MSDATSIGSARDRRWLILGVIGLAQLMVVLDLTVAHAVPGRRPGNNGTNRGEPRPQERLTMNGACTHLDQIR